MPTIKLNLTIGIDEEHDDFIDEIDEELPEGQDAIELIEQQLEGGIGPRVEEMIYQARQQTKYSSGE